MSYTRGVHYINPELDKHGGEFRSGRRLYSVNKNQSQGLVYRFEEGRDSRGRMDRPSGYTPQQDYNSQGYSPMKPDSEPALSDPRQSEELFRLREAIRQKDEELRAMQEQAYVPPAYPRSTAEPEPMQLSRNPNFVEFERAKRDDVNGTQQRRKTAEALAYQINEKQRVKELERQAREIETAERLDALRRMQEDDYQRKADQRSRAMEYRRMLDVQAQSKSHMKPQSYATRGYVPEYAERQPDPTPLRDATNTVDYQKSFAQNAASFYGDEMMQAYSPAQPAASNPFSQPIYSRRTGRNYKDTSQLLG